MRDILRTMALVACIAAAAAGAVLQTGCTSTREHRSTGQTLDDASITATVKTDLLRDPAVSATAINVDTYRGNVQLNGWVNDNQQKAEAERIARGVNGVVSVQNNLQVKPEPAGAPQSR